MEPQEGLPCVQEYALRETCPFEETPSGKGQDTSGTVSEPNTTWSLDKDFQEWCKGNDISILYTKPGSPTPERIYREVQWQLQNDCT